MLARSWDRNSVRRSVRYTRALWRNERTYDILIPQIGQSIYSLPKEAGGRYSLPREIGTYSDSPHVKNADFDQYLLITSQP